VLKGKRGDDCRVMRQHVEQGIAAIDAEKNFTDAAIQEMSCGQLIARAIALECDRYGWPSVRQAIARWHCLHAEQFLQRKTRYNQTPANTDGGNGAAFGGGIGAAF
jgi:hypothetical protein